MTRFAAILSSCFLATATPSLAAPITFVPQLKNSTFTFVCTPATPSAACGIKPPEFYDDAEGDYVANPGAAFSFLKFEPADSDDSNGGGSNSEEKNDDDRSFGTFELTVNLLLKIKNSTQEVWLKSTGQGTFETEDGDFSAFSLIWDAIPNFEVDGAGLFAASFSERSRQSETYARRDGDDDEDEEEDRYDFDDEYYYVQANISPVPLPAGAWLLLSGLGLLGVARLRRRPQA